jgi:hypothetical protein
MIFSAALQAEGETRSPWSGLKHQNEKAQHGSFCWKARWPEPSLALNWRAVAIIALENPQQGCLASLACSYRTERESAQPPDKTHLLIGLQHSFNSGDAA